VHGQLEERIAYHDKRARRWRWEQSRTKESETDDAPLLPEHMCEHEEEKHTWLADVLGFVRDHIEPQASVRRRSRIVMSRVMVIE
jgi:hypothetical protein